MTQEREIELVEQILNGNKALYAEIVRAYQVQVINLCYRLVGDKVDVKKVVQQVFVELYTALPRFRHESRLSTFIYSITVNVVMGMLRHENRMLSLEQDWFPEESHQNSDELLDRMEQEKKLRSAIGRLNPEQRTALVLVSFNNFTYREVAEVMNVSVSKVESLLYRAKQNLKEIMTNNK